MARRYRARVTLLHAMEIPGSAYPGWPVYGPAMDLKGMEEDGRARVESFLGNEFQGVDHGSPDARRRPGIPDRGIRGERGSRSDYDADAWLWSFPALSPLLGHRQGASRCELRGLDKRPRA